MKKVSLCDLFVKLAQPDENGISRWVNVSEFSGEYEALKLGNGLSWGRSSSFLAKKYIIEVDKKQTPGNGIDRIRLNGFNEEDSFSQYINPKIVQEIQQQKCVMLGVKGISENTRIEVDHKDGRKNDMRVSNPSLQKMSDFFLLSGASRCRFNPSE